jgi:hypothetical protein
MFKPKFTYSIEPAGWVAASAGYEWYAIIRRRRLPFTRGRIIHIALGLTREDARQQAVEWMRIVGSHNK